MNGLLGVNWWTRRSRVVAATVSILACLSLAASPPHREQWTDSFPGYTKQLWQVPDGLPAGSVQSLAQTPDGYLWAGTTGGLVRFDGAEFKVYSQSNTPEFHSDLVFCLLTSHDGTLWIGTVGGGLLRYRDGIFRAYSHAQGLTNESVRAIFEDHRGRIWVGTDGGLFQIRGDAASLIAYPPMSDDAVHAITEDAQGAIWVGGAKLSRLTGTTAVEYPLLGISEQLAIKSLLVQPDGTVLVGTVSGLMRVRIRSRSAVEWSRIPGVTGTVRVLRQAKDSSLWIGTIGHGIFILRNGSLQHFAAPEALPSNIVLDMLADKDGNLWFGTQTGLMRLSRTEATTLRIPGIADSDFGSIYQDKQGSLWIASGRLWRLDRGSLSEYHVPRTPEIKIRNVLKDTDGALWIGTEGQGIYFVRGQQVTQYTKQRDGLANNFIHALLQAKDGTIWAATDGGLSHWVNRRWQTYLERDGLAYFSTVALLEDSRSTIWIGTDGGLSHWVSGRLQSDEITRALGQQRIGAMLEDREGGLWFGTHDDGLFRWRAGKLSHFTMGDGLSSNNIYSILEDPEERMWFSSPNAVTEATLKDIDDAAVRPGFHPRFKLYGVSAGLPAADLYGTIQPAGVVAANGDLWYPSAAGPVRIHPGSTTATKTPVVHLDSLTIDGRNVGVGNAIDLGTSGSRLEFRFHSIQLDAHELVRYSYKLDGFDRNWHETTQGIADYTNLPAGGYRFLVKAYNVNDPETSTEAALRIRRHPQFYRTWWFALLCASVAGLIAWLLHWTRARAQEERFSAVLEERNRVAREVHDTLIQGCIGVSSLLEALSSLDDRGIEHDDKLINAARLQVRSTIEEAREAIWDMRSGPVVARDIVTSLETIASNVTRQFELPIQFEVSGRSVPVDTTVAHELMMIAREALYNAARHGKSSHVSLTVEFAPHAIHVRIRDDGEGFELSQGQTTREKHFGLTIMKERIESVGGQLAIQTSSGRGTELTITVGAGRP